MEDRSPYLLKNENVMIFIPYIYVISDFYETNIPKMYCGIYSEVICTITRVCILRITKYNTYHFYMLPKIIIFEHQKL